MNNIEIYDKEKIIYTTDSTIYNIYKDSKVIIYDYCFNKSHQVIINLWEESASVEYHLSYINILDNEVNITVNHLASNTISNIYNHGLNVKNNKLVFNVIGSIPKDSFKCICNQDNQIINLENGNSIIKPNLLIDNYDSYSNHSAYIGKFKEEVLFYALSRGIKENTATLMLIKSLLINGGSKEEKIVQDFFNQFKEYYDG